MVKRKRRSNFTAQEKIAIVRRHLLEQQPISELCEQYLGIQPSKVLRLAAALRQGQRTQRSCAGDFWLEDWERTAIVNFHDAPKANALAAATTAFAFETVGRPLAMPYRLSLSMARLA